MFYVTRLRKRLRCLGFCYIDIGDWGINKAQEAREDYIRLHGEHVTPFFLLKAPGEFDDLLVKHRRMFREIGMMPPGQKEMNYILEGII